MNILLWIAQIVLALLALAGGAYKLVGFDALAGEAWYATLPRAGWGALGLFELLCGGVLLVSLLAKGLRPFVWMAAAGLGIESLLLGALYGHYSTVLAAGNPLTWVLLMLVLAAFVAYGRRTHPASLPG